MPCSVFVHPQLLSNCNSRARRKQWPRDLLPLEGSIALKVGRIAREGWKEVGGGGMGVGGGGGGWRLPNLEELPSSELTKGSLTALPTCSYLNLT